MDRADIEHWCSTGRRRNRINQAQNEERNGTNRAVGNGINFIPFAYTRAPLNQTIQPNPERRVMPYMPCPYEPLNQTIQPNPERRVMPYMPCPYEPLNQTIQPNPERRVMPYMPCPYEPLNHINRPLNQEWQVVMNGGTTTYSPCPYDRGVLNYVREPVYQGQVGVNGIMVTPYQYDRVAADHHMRVRRIMYHRPCPYQRSCPLEHFSPVVLYQRTA